jgi:hypothetical protein
MRVLKKVLQGAAIGFVIASVFMGGGTLSLIPSHALAATTCQIITIQGNDSVQVGNSISVPVSAGCGKGIAGITWVCYWNPVADPPNFSTSGGGNNTDGSTQPIIVTGVKEGTATLTENYDCSDGVDPDQHPTNDVTITVTPAPVAAPTITVTAAPTSVTAGGASSLTITTTNATVCTATAGLPAGTSVPCNGFKTVAPPTTTTYTVSATGPGGTASNSATVTVTVPAPGTINVTSEDSQIASVLVPAKWDLLDGAAYRDACAVIGAVCQGTQQTYMNQPVGLATIPVATVSLLNPGTAPQYAFGGMKLTPASLKSAGFIGSMLSLVKNVFESTADAAVTIVPPQATLNSSGTIGFTILWDPIASIAVTPGTLTLNSPTGVSVTGQATVTNTGAPGSNLTWTAAPSAAWLSVSPAANASGIKNGASGNASQSVTVTANPSGLTAGTTYTGTITFTGVSAITEAPGTNPPTATLTVTFTFANGGGIPSPGNPSSTVTGITVNCNPTTVEIGLTSACGASLTGGTGSGVTWTVASGPGSITSAGVYRAPSSVIATTTVTIKATSVQTPTISGTEPITVVMPPIGPIPPITVTCTPNSITTSQVSACTSPGNPTITCTMGSGPGSVNASTCVYTPPTTVTATTTVTIIGTAPGKPPGTAPIVVTTPPSTIIIVCAPNPITTAQQSTCTSPSNPLACAMGSGPGSVNASTCVYTPPTTVTATTTVTIIGTAPGGTATATITVIPSPACTPGFNCPVCSPVLTASPASIVVPESSNLQYSCTHVTTCQLVQDGNPSSVLATTSGGTAESIDSTYPVAPSTTTTYTLSCVNSNYTGTGSTITSNATVTVGGSNLCEQNPNGAGCPGQ